APSTWYFATLQAPGLDVAGATMPGVPYVIVGRTPNVAWGVTNTGPDVQDLYLERLRPDDPTQYQTPDGYRPLITHDERIAVKGADPVIHTVRATRHGPVISGLNKTVDEAVGTPAYLLSLRWTALEGVDTTLQAVRNMNRARSADEFVAALRGWTVVQQSFVFADQAGAIGMVAAGRVPTRRPDNDLRGLVPAPGWDARYDWTGVLPFEALPQVRDPADGILVTANHKITPAGYAPHITYDWFLPYRAQRIDALLRARRDHTAESFGAIQADVTSLAARDLLDALKALSPAIEPATPAGRVARDRLWAWDGAMRVDAPEPLLFHAWLQRLRTRIFADELAAVAPDLVDTSELTQPLLNVLRGAALSRSWCDDRNTTRPETCAELAQESLDATVTELASRTGKDILGLRWGDVHRAQIEHRPFSNVPVLRKLFGRQAEVGGDSFTVNVAQLSLKPTAPFSTRHAASMRVIFDLAPDGTDRWVLPGGQSGHPLSPHYDDQLPLWQRAELLSRPPAAPASPTTTPR
ncbi:MAG: penicillin acylase family protein, partial [Burkholderiaceae bacterium]|nr:penicillin acylase family protein [Burkholderiaceae bacterium]